MCVFQKHDDYNLREPEMTLGRAHECSIFSHNCHFPVLRRIESEVYAQLGINYRTLNDRASLIKCSRSRPGDQGHHSATKKCRFDGKKGIHETKRLRHSKPMNWGNGKNQTGEHQRSKAETARVHIPRTSLQTDTSNRSAPGPAT